MFRAYLAFTLALGVAICGPAHAEGTLANSLLKLDPTEMVAQVCDLGALSAFGRDKQYHRADRVLIDAISTPRIKGEKVSGDGGAFRAEGKWYRFDYSCTLTPDHMKTVSFDYKVRGDIPQARWDELGLWP